MTHLFQVGLSEERKMFILVGTSRVEFTAYAEFSGEELKNCKVLLRDSNDYY